MSVHHTAGERLAQALMGSGGTAGCLIEVVDQVDKPWSAAMFDGGLHEVSLSVSGDAAQWWLDGLDENAICLRGYVLSSLVVSTVEPDAGRTGMLIATVEAETVREA